MENKEENIKVYEIESDQWRGKAKIIKNTLKSFQTEVGGNIEIPYISDDLGSMEIDLIINAEGKINGLDPSLVLIHENEPFDVVAGTVFFTTTDSDGDFKSLSDEQIKYLEEKIGNKHRKISQDNRFIKVAGIEI